MSGANYTRRLGIFVYGATDGATLPIVEGCLELVEQEHRHEPNIRAADIAIAPLLTSFLGMEEINTPRYGTLVFHPSLLPRHRGADAIKWAFKLREAYTGVSWFWPDEGIDTGDLCEQEVLAIHPDEAPREFYERAVIPAALRTLKRALEDVAADRPRRVPQILSNGSYEPRIKRRDS